MVVFGVGMGFAVAEVVWLSDVAEAWW